MPTLLAFDTSTERMHVALDAGGRVWVRDLDGAAAASARLIPAILALLDEAGIGFDALDAIGFGRGPGAFTGLRTACSVAQGLAWGANKPVLALDSLLATAEDARAGAPRWRGWVTMDARMDEVYAAGYDFADGHWRCVAAPRLSTPERLAEAWRSDAPGAVAGSAHAVFGGRLDAGAAAWHDDARPRGAALIELARAQWEAGLGLDAAQAVPTYLRDKVAQTVAERDAAARAKQAAAAAAGAMP